MKAIIKNEKGEIIDEIITINHGPNVWYIKRVSTRTQKVYLNLGEDEVLFRAIYQTIDNYEELLK